VIPDIVQTIEVWNMNCLSEQAWNVNCLSEQAWNVTCLSEQSGSVNCLAGFLISLNLFSFVFMENEQRPFIWLRASCVQALIRYIEGLCGDLFRTVDYNESVKECCHLE